MQPFVKLFLLGLLFRPIIALKHINEGLRTNRQQEIMNINRAQKYQHNLIPSACPFPFLITSTAEVNYVDINLINV